METCRNDACQALQTAEAPRAGLLSHALRLEYLTVGWNIIEGLIAVTAALAAGSIALLGFGVDSFVESASGSILIWRLLAERHAKDPEAIEQLDQKAHKLVALSLFALAAFTGVAATADAVHRNREVLVGLGADRAVAHRAGRKALHDLGSWLHLIQRHRRVVRSELPQTAQGDRAVRLVVDELGVLLVALHVLQPHRVL